MGKRFTKADDLVLGRLDQVCKQYRSDLLEHGVRIGVIMVEPNKTEKGDVTSPAITVHGHSALACVRLTRSKERALLPYDVVMEIDADWWEDEDISDGRRDAVLHHELCHVRIEYDAEGRPVERPDRRESEPNVILELHPGDFYIGDGFVEVAKAHGFDAYEVSRFVDLHDRVGQLLFPFAPPDKKKKSA